MARGVDYGFCDLLSIPPSHTFHYAGDPKHTAASSNVLNLIEHHMVAIPAFALWKVKFFF